MSIDFVPTIVELVSQAGPAGQVDPAQPRNWDGVSFAAQLKDPKAKLDRDALYWHYPHYHSAGGRPYGAIRKGDMKLIEHYENGAIELYDLANDVGETTDVGAARPELARQLSEQLAAWRRDVGAQMCTPAH